MDTLSGNKRSQVTDWKADEQPTLLSYLNILDSTGIKILQLLRTQGHGEAEPTAIFVVALHIKKYRQSKDLLDLKVWTDTIPRPVMLGFT